MPQLTTPKPQCLPSDFVSINVLEELAAELKFMSVPLRLPADCVTGEFNFWLEGEPYTDGYVREIYAPGDKTGWAVVYIISKDGIDRGETEVIYGTWKVERV